MGQAAGEQPRRASVGLGRIVVSETEAPNLLGTLGMKRMGGRTQQCSWALDERAGRRPRRCPVRAHRPARRRALAAALALPSRPSVMCECVPSPLVSSASPTSLPLSPLRRLFALACSRSLRRSTACRNAGAPGDATDAPAACASARVTATWVRPHSSAPASQHLGRRRGDAS